MNYKLIPFSYYDPFERLGYNSILLEKAKNGDSFISLTGWNQMHISIGKHQDPKAVLNKEYIKKRNIPFLQRESGGGAVINDTFTISYGIVSKRNNFPKDITLLYESISAIICTFLLKIGIKASYKPINDIVTKNGKISGSAILEKEEIIYIMGSILYKKDKNLMNAVLYPEKDFKESLPEIKKKLSSISEESTCSFEEAVTTLTQTFKEKFSCELYTFSKEERAEAKKYAKKIKEKQKNLLE